MARLMGALGLVALLLGTAPACASGGQAGNEEAPALAAGEFSVTGVVRKTEVGVDCWRFEGADGTSYELLTGQVPAGILVDGKSMTLVLTPRDDLMSTCMVGRIVDVVRVAP